MKEPSFQEVQIPNFRQCNGSQLCRTEAENTCPLMKSLVCPIEQVEMILRHPSQPKVWASDLTVHLILKQWFVDSI